jgi:hypothetical protein
MRDTLIRVDEETWVNPTQVAAVEEDYFSALDEWLVRVYLKGRRVRCVTLTGTRATTVAALLNGEELR